MAARLGLEPRQNESESFVLPLHHRAKKLFAFGEEPAALGFDEDLKARRLAAPPVARRAKGGAGDGIRTRNRLFTKQVLYH